MGVCINNRLGQNKVYVKSTLDNCENMAHQIKKAQADLLGIRFEIKRISDYSLHINIGHCETLAFDFKSVKQILEEKEAERFSYEYEVITDGGKYPMEVGYKIDEFPQNEIWYSAGFTKTQFSKSMVEHKWVADLTRIVAGRCVFAKINDEGDYYHSGELKDAEGAIKENGALINSLVKGLTDLGYDKQ